MLDLAAGSGRHAAVFADRGHPVTALDRDISRLAAHPRIEAVEADIEGGPWPFPDRRFAGIVVANYLHRPLFTVLCDSLLPGGALIYETFAVGNEQYGKPRNPDFLLKESELLDAVAGKLRVVAYEAGLEHRTAGPAIVQRIAAVLPDGEGTVPAIPPPA